MKQKVTWIDRKYNKHVLFFDNKQEALAFCYKKLDPGYRRKIFKPCHGWSCEPAEETNETEPRG